MSLVPPAAIQSLTMVNPGNARDPNVMDIDTQEAMVALGYEQVTPEMLGYELPSPDMGYGEAATDMGYEDAVPDMGYGDAAPDMGYGDASPDMGYGDATPDADMGYESAEVDMGYGPAEPEIAAPAAVGTTRRASMSACEQTQRRASIKAIMNDPNVSPMAKRRSIHHLMDGRRGSMNGSSHPTPAAPDLSEEESSPYGTDQEDHNHEITRHFTTNDNAKRAEQQRPPCTHYERKCTLIAPCCGAAFGCRICHDDCPTLPPKINPKVKKSRYSRRASCPSNFTSMTSSQPEDMHHTIDRFAIQEVICRECFTRQSSKTYVYPVQFIPFHSVRNARHRTKRPYPYMHASHSNLVSLFRLHYSDNCISCGVLFGGYHCDKCNLWMANEEDPYHCEDCGFCRVGGKDNFQHCHDCEMCIDKSLFDNHNCKSGKYKSNCPVCQEYLFSSRSASHEMPCGHAIHWECFRQLAAHDSRCPICKKTAETRERMMPTWTAMAQGIALQPVPPELSRVVNMSCNDCERADDARAWHFLGIQCQHCQSFNTVVDRLVLNGYEAHEFLEVNNRQEEAVTAPASPTPRRRRRMNRRSSAM